MSINSATTLAVLGSATLSHYSATTLSASLPVVAVSNSANQTIQTAKPTQPAMTTNTTAFLKSTGSANEAQTPSNFATMESASVPSSGSVTTQAAVVTTSYASNCYRLPSIVRYYKAQSVSDLQGRIRSISGGKDALRFTSECLLGFSEHARGWLEKYQDAEAELVVTKQELAKYEAKKDNSLCEKCRDRLAKMESEKAAFVASISESKSKNAELTASLKEQTAELDKVKAELSVYKSAETGTPKAPAKNDESTETGTPEAQLADCQASKDGWKAAAAALATTVAVGGSAAAVYVMYKKRQGDGNDPMFSGTRREQQPLSGRGNSRIVVGSQPRAQINDTGV